MTTRRSMLKSGVALGATAALPGGLLAVRAAEPIKSLQIFVPAAPGGGWDATGRAIEHSMRADKLVESFQVEHAPGAGGVVGLPKFISSKKGQGNAIMVGGMVMVGSIIANKAPVKLTDVVPLARLTGEVEVIAVPAASPFKTMGDLVAAFKADPGKISWAGGSAGGTDHILAGMIARAVGVDPKKVAYVAYSGGGPALAAMVGNQVSCGISGWNEFSEQIKAGKLRALAVSSGQRLEGIDVATLKEQGVDVELFNWRGVFGAPGITPEQRAGLVDLLGRMTQGPAWQGELKKRDWIGVYLAGDDFAKYLEAEIARVTSILKDIGLAS